MNAFNLIIAVLYFGAVGQAIFQAKPAFACLYACWGLGCLAVAYIETQ